MQEAYGDSQERPEKIEINRIGWDKDAQQFVVSGNIQVGIATAGENADFPIILKTTIYDSRTGDHLYTMIWILNELTERLENFEASQPWDRNIDLRTGDSFEGNVDITVEGIILSPSGEAVDRLEITTFEDIPVIPLDCSDHRDCPELVPCLFCQCVPENAPIPVFCDNDSDCPPALNCTFGICLPF